MMETTLHWWPAWRAHVNTGRALSCGYQTGANTCRRPNTEGAAVIYCHACNAGTQQARYARLTHRAIEARRA